LLAIGKKLLAKLLAIESQRHNQLLANCYTELLAKLLAISIASKLLAILLAIHYFQLLSIATKLLAKLLAIYTFQRFTWNCLESQAICSSARHGNPINCGLPGKSGNSERTDREQHAEDAELLGKSGNLLSRGGRRWPRLPWNAGIAWKVRQL